MMTEIPTDLVDETEPDAIVYPGVSDCIKAAITDSVVLIVFMTILTYAFSLFDTVPESARMAGFIFIFGLYDPLFTSFFGGTIGHMVMRIRVKRVGNHEKNILLPFALVRYLFKVLLGWISLLTIGSNAKSLAIHDIVARSIVVFKR